MTDRLITSQSASVHHGHLLACAEKRAEKRPTPGIRNHKIEVTSYKASIPTFLRREAFDAF